MLRAERTRIRSTREVESHTAGPGLVLVVYLRRELLARAGETDFVQGNKYGETMGSSYVPAKVAFARHLASPMVVAAILRIAISTTASPAKRLGPIAVELSSTAK